jgi:hypothetical protein
LAQIDEEFDGLADEEEEEEEGLLCRSKFCWLGAGN